jgi:catechol 2,3-dioxygenase-like lactoylglutathione lyase family enzyme
MSNERNNATLSARLQGVQHFGVTVQNMDRAFKFYTEVLGGTEVMRDGDFHGEKIHNTLMTDEEIVARERKVNPRTIGVPDLRGGEQRLDVRFTPSREEHLTALERAALERGRPLSRRRAGGA